MGVVLLLLIFGCQYGKKSLSEAREISYSFPLSSHEREDYYFRAFDKGYKFLEKTALFDNTKIDFIPGPCCRQKAITPG